MDGHYPFVLSAFWRDDYYFIDFTAITGMSFSGEPIPMSNEAYNSAVVKNMWLNDLFRATTSVKYGCFLLVWYMQLVDKVRSAYDAGRVSSE